MTNKVVIPEYIDNPPQILFLEADDLAPFLAGCGFGVLLKFITNSSWNMVIGITIGIILTNIYLRFKRNALPGILLHILYAYGVIKLNKKFKNGLIKRLVN